MGLDMYAFTTRTKIEVVDFDAPDAAKQLHYWRKHPNLHGWMEALYRAKGGEGENFNGDCVWLDLADLDRLEAAVKGKALPQTEGFFFGKSKPEDADDDLRFIGKARAAIKRGLYVFYTSCW